MNFDEWEPVYEAILADFGYERGADEQARDLLVELLSGADVGGLDRLDVTGKTVAVAGAADTLEDEFEPVRGADVVFGASNAASRLRKAGLSVDCMVTDIDKRPDTAQALTAEGTPVAVHAHGDNIPALRDVVPELDPRSLVPTTQAQPAGPVRNVGGFTDGDRAAFLADALGAERLVFPGWAFDDATVGAEKQRKLTWAARLLHWLERRRDERFAVLDGRRTDLDMSAFPV
jgi:uncharacterized Rossmann fold enzyme